LTLEPNQTGGTDSRQEESYPEATQPQAPQPGDAGPSTLFDGLTEAWALAPSTDLPRHVGQRAVLAALKAKARRLESQQESAAAAAAHREIARRCWTNGFDYAEAIRSANRVLELCPEDPIRIETADRLEGIGAHLAGAELLAGSRDAVAAGEVASIHRRLAALSHRAGDAETAAMHFAELARIEPDATDALAAIGTMAGWAPGQVSRERGVVAWHEAARRFKLRGSQLAAFEAVHRAFELDPASSLAAERLAQDLEALGRHDAADEVWRQSAVAAGDSARHDLRAVAALEAGDIIRAFAAMLDGRADSAFDMSQLLLGVEHLLAPQLGISRGFDMVLAELGCADWLTVRLEAGPLLERWTDEANCHVALGRLEANYFAHSDAAREALVRAIIVQPAQPEARARLSSSVTHEDAPDLLVRALVQSARAAQGGLVARQLAGEIVERARGEPHAASLRLWALERLQGTGHLTDELRAEQTTCAALAAQDDAELFLLQSKRPSATDEQRVATLRDLERRLAVDPNRVLDHLATVVALVDIDPNDAVQQSSYLELLDVVARLVISPTRDERISIAIAEASRLLGERGRIAQAKFHLRHGQIEHALSALLPLLEDKTPSIRGLLWLFTLARRFRDALTSARALERVSAAFRPAIRGVLEALSAELYLEAHCPQEAMRLVADTVRTNQNLSRLVTLETRLAEFSDPREGAEGIERALSKVFPDAALCRVLSRAHQRIGEPDVALAWTQRALSLRPGDVELRNQQLQLALDVGNPRRVVDILDELMVQALPFSAWAEVAASALAWLTSVDAAPALEMGKRLLDFVGASDRSLRAALLETAQVNGDEAFAIEVLERAAAIATDYPPIQLALAERRWQQGDIEAGLLAALRAARAGAPVEGWSGYIGAETEGLSADAKLMRLELSRLALERDARTNELRQALRTLAVARFDLAQDTDGAVEVWREIGQVSGFGDWGCAARDMGEVLGARSATARLLDLSRTIIGGAERAKVLGLGAQLSFEAGDATDALRHIEQALSVASESTCLLPFGERLTDYEGGSERLESLYGIIERSVLGIYGERSLHHRAARAFEKRGEWNLALRHALLAFEVLPDDDATWRTLVRVSRAASEPQMLANAAMRVAEAARDRSFADRWLARAFQQLGDSPDELRLKFDLAIRMLVGAPQVRRVREVADCIRLMQRAEVEEVDFMRMRFERALEALIVELEGPDGARLGIAIAEVAATDLGRFDLSSQALLAALKADADLEEFGGLVSALVPRVSAAKEVFSSMLHRAIDWLERPYVQAGQESLGLLFHLATALLDEGSLSRVVRCAAKTGRDAWLRQWVDEDLLPRLFDGKDGRVGAIALARVWTEADLPDFALTLLGRTAELFAQQSPASSGERPVDSIWQEFCEQYETAIAALPLPEQVSLVRQRVLGLEPLVPVPVVSTLKVAVERRSSDPRALCSVLAELAFVGVGTAQRRSELLIEAAGIAQELGDLEAALVYYRAAVGTQRSSVAARLGLCVLMVRMGRHRTEGQAQFLLDTMVGLEPSVAEEQRDVVVFLQAEALEMLGRVSDARRWLEDAEARIGPRPLIVLGLAEHAVRDREPALALGYYAAALGGNLRQLRRPSEVSLAAARAAATVGDVRLALEWLQPCLNDSVIRPDALVLQAELQGAADLAVTDGASTTETAGAADKPLEQLLDSMDTSRIVTLAPARDDLDSEERSHVARSPSGETVLCEIPLIQTVAIKGDSTAEASMAIGEVSRGVVSAADGFNQGKSGGPANHDAPPKSDRRADELPSASMQFVEPSALELAIAAAEQAAIEPEQLRAWLSDGKRWLRQWPLSIRLAELVRDAVRLESNPNHVAALEHLIGVLRGDVELAQPTEIGEQPVDIDGLRSLLLRDLTTPESEALALVWDGAEHEFLREASDYEVTGVMRVVGTASPLARIYSEVVRHFGIPKTPLFFRRSPQPTATRVLLLSPTAALLEGEPSADELLTSYRVGCALWATLPEYSLVFGLDRDRVPAVLRALGLAFGSTGEQPNATSGESLRLAQVLWQTVKSRSQRRLKEICVSELDFARVWAASTQSTRRAGLYVCGDLRAALRAASVDLGIDPASIDGNRWTQVCQLAPELLDLFRFAAGAEYADIRWQLGRPAQLGGGVRTP
jgi:tetratricopeptide (TPR) repeat protein